MPDSPLPSVIAVSKRPAHTFSKDLHDSITLLTALGVEGDAHCGVTVKHRSRVAKNPDQPNLRQVHLVHSELHEELAAQGFQVGPGQIGENITTRGIDLLQLPRSTRLHIGATAVVEVTGLRNPCSQLDSFQAGLMAALLSRDEQGRLIRKAGVMGIVLRGGTVFPNDRIVIALPDGPQLPLEPV